MMNYSKEKKCQLPLTTWTTEKEELLPKEDSDDPLTLDELSKSLVYQEKGMR